MFWILLTLVLTIGALIFSLETIRLVEVTPLDRGDFQITIETTNHGWFPRRRTYVGSGTVWHELPTFQRPGTIREGALASLMERYFYEYRQRYTGGLWT